MTKSASAAATPVQDSSCSLSYDHDEKKDQKEEHHTQQQQQLQQKHHQRQQQHATASAGTAVAAVIVESADVRQARKGLLKVLLEHNFMPKFSSTPVLLRDDAAAAAAAAARPVVERSHHTQHAHTHSHTSITASERDYLESLLQSGDAQHLRAASDRLQDVTLFPKEQQHAINDDLTSTEQRLPRRRDSQVQQQLFKLHEQAGVHQRPSVMLQRMMQQQQHASTADSSSFHNNNSLLVQEEASLSFDDSNSIVDYAAANSRTAISRRQQALQQRTNSILETSGTMDESEMAATNHEATGTATVAEAEDDDDFLALEEEEQDGFESGGGSKGIGMGLFATVGRQKVASRPMYYRQQNSILAGENNDTDAATITSTTNGVDDDNDVGSANLTKATKGGSDGTWRTATASAGTLTTTTGPSLSSTSGTTFRILGTWADDVSCHPHVLSPPLMESLLAFIPESMAENYHYYLKYSLVRDGGGIATLLRHARASHTTILAIETTDGHVFGSFTGVGWRLSRGWYGSSEAFLWKMRRSRRNLESSSTSSSTTTGRQRSIVQQAMQESEIQVFPFRPGNVAVQYCSKECIMLGQGELLVMRNNNNNNNNNAATTNTTTAVAHATPSEAATSVSALPPTEQASSPHSSARKPDEEGTTTSTTTTAAESSAPTTASHGSQHYGHGLYLQADLLEGSTSTSETFGNPCLVNDTLRGARFQVENLEVWTLTPHDTLEQAQESELSSLFLEGDDYPKKDLNLLGILVGGSNS